MFFLLFVLCVFEIKKSLKYQPMLSLLLLTDLKKLALTNRLFLISLFQLMHFRLCRKKLNKT